MYRTHECAQLNLSLVDKQVKIAGFIRKKRNHGNVLFIDLADASGIMQCVIEKNDAAFNAVEKISLESVVTLSGKLVKRSDATVNKNIDSGSVELIISECSVLSKAQELPFAIYQEDLNEELQLKNRFLYLRRNDMQNMLKLRTRVIDTLRSNMKGLGFLEVQTPLLSSSSPEGARDYLVPSRLNPGKFFALPQAPQQFKQLLMTSGVEKYFQIAPCFRDEDSRADRLLGEFYQLDFEMAFATQEDVFEILEKTLYNLFAEVRSDCIINSVFPKISYKDSLEKYGSDKPDLRNPLEFCDVTEKITTPEIFKDLIKNGYKMHIISANVEQASNKFFKQLQEFMIQNGAQGLAYAVKKEEWSGPLAKLISHDEKEELLKKDHNCLFMIVDCEPNLHKLCHTLRTELGKKLNLINKNEYKFCFIVDFPMFEKKDDGWDFMHNPFSMPQDLEKPLEEVLAYQYDLVCNGYELSSGAVRNHDLEKIKKVFALIGQSCDDLEKRFPVFKAFKYGVPPHAGSAPGIDRIIMLLSNQENVRNTMPFPLNQHGQSLLMDAPCIVDEKYLKDLNIKLNIKD